MADISDEDRKAIFGENWRTISGTQSNADMSPIQRNIAEQEISSSAQWNAVLVVLFGLFMAGVALYRQSAAPYEYLIGTVIALLGAAWLAYLRVKRPRAP